MITVPKAGTSAGASAQLQVGVDQSGSALAQLGDRMAQLGHQWRVDQINRDTRKAQLGITQDMALLRMNVDQIGDTAQIGPAWDAGVAEIRKRYEVEGQDPLLRENIGLAIDDLSAQHTTALAGRVVALNQSQERADFADFAATSAKSSGGADDTTYEAFKAQGIARIDDMVQSGKLTPEEGQRYRATFLTDLATPRVDAAIQADPTQALADIEAGKFGDLSPDALEAARKVARSEIAQRARADKVATDQAGEAMVKRLNTVSDLMEGGRSIQDLTFLGDSATLDLAAKDPKVAAALARAKAAEGLLAEMPGVRGMTPQQLNAAIDAERDRPIDASKPWEAERLGILTKWRDQAAQHWASDPIGTAIDARMAPDKMLTFDPAQTAAFSAGLADRLGLAQSLKTNGYTQTLQPFTTDEQAQLKIILDPKADAGTKLALAQATVAGAKDQWQVAATAMGASDEMRGAMRVLQTSGDMSLAAQILSGERKLATDVAAAPSGLQLRAVFADVTGGAFDNDPATAAVLMKSAAAAYAEVAPPADPSAGAKPFSEDAERTTLYTQVLQRVMGAKPDPQGGLTIGGLQSINGSMTMLPQGLSAGFVQQGLDLLGERGDQRLPGIFAKASLTGASTPNLGPDPGAWLSQAQLIPVPNRPGLFTMQVVQNGRAKVVPTAEDGTRPYVFDLRNLVTAAQALQMVTP